MPEKSTEPGTKTSKQIPLVLFIWGMILTFFLGGFTVLVVVVTQRNHQSVATGLDSSVTNSKEFAKFSQIYDAISGQYYEKVSQEKLMNGAINGMIGSLKDPYSEYLEKTDATDLNTTIDGSFDGIGAEMKQGKTYLEVVTPIDGAPAKKAGLKAGDLITKVDGKSTAGWTISQGVAKIKGKANTQVKLTIKRGERTFDLAITRGKVPVKTVTTKLDKNNQSIGHLQISSFSDPTFDEVKKGITKLRKDGAKKFIIDVRGNPGGLLKSGVTIASMFLKNGKKITTIEYRDKSQNETYTAGENLDQGFKVTEPTVVLIDNGSASAAEIFAGALSQSANIRLIGTKSFGKGVMQSLADFNDGSEFKITEGKWLTPNGNSINKQGLSPNIKADYPKYAYTPVISSDKTLKVEEVSDDVKSLQTFLQALGYEVGTVNGYYGPATVAAVQSFQTNQSLPVTGEADPTTVRTLLDQVQTKISENDGAYQAGVKALTE